MNAVKQLVSRLMFPLVLTCIGLMVFLGLTGAITFKDLFKFHLARTAVFFAAEALLPDKPRRWFGWKVYFTDSIHFMLRIYPNFLSHLFVGIAWLMATYPVFFWKPDFGFAWNPWLGLLLTGVTIELGAYWIHRTMHEVPWLWQFHQCHHSSQHYYIGMWTRSHPIEDVIMYVILTYAFAILGIQPMWVMLWTFVIQNTLSQLAHSNILYHPGFLVNWLITSRTHRMHHSTLREESSTNYGISFLGWDRLFKTFNLPRPGQEPKEYGLGYDYPNQNIVGHMLRVLPKMKKKL